MKKYLLFCILILLAIGLVFTDRRFRSSVPSSALSDADSVKNMQTNQRDKIDIEGNAKTSSATSNLFKTVINQESGLYADVNSDREIVTLKDKAGNISWSRNVIEELKNVPVLGDKKINSMQLIKEDLVVRVGRGYARIDKKTGNVEWLGSD